MSFRSITIMSITVLFCLPGALFAAEIVLRSGQKVEGAIIEQTDTYVKVDFMDVPLTYFLEDIDSIDGVSVVLPAKDEPVKEEPAQEASAQEPAAKQEPKEVTESKPESAEDYFYRGVSSVKIGNLEEAFADFTKAIELNPKISEVYYNRGNIAKKKGNFDGAASDFSKAIEINPKYKEAYNNRATVYFTKKEFEAASQDVRKAEELGYNVNPKFLKMVQNALEEQKK